MIRNLLTDAISQVSFLCAVRQPLSVFAVPTTGSGSPLALIVCFVPRILVGVFPSLVYNGMRKILKDKMNILCLTVSGIVGSFTNTLLVMHFIYFFFRDSYAEARNIALDAVYGVILGIIAANGIPEAIMAALFTAAVCVPLKIVYDRQ